MAEAIMFGSVAASAAFYVAWLALPGLRAWIEMPKHHFQGNVERYDSRQRSAAEVKGRAS